MGATLIVLFCVLFYCSPIRADRSDAFIGYSEQGRSEKLPKCVDRESSCSKWEQDKQCIFNPYFMRESCPVACK
jgi:ShK domain-like